ncbi:MAG: hypothetical protein C4617_05525 [Candidatus Liberibacter europaeus]|uniref:Uncharacterized protein n=1 Tax=Candidatus Liberibacter europaeus TaxID=744859 RepID=A0A2T4VWD9_9HYPH|nr:MAG: hypothetical protein C4617_05525 [Candidatus Liberibacter europaeus]
MHDGAELSAHGLHIKNNPEFLNEEMRHLINCILMKYGLFFQLRTFGDGDIKYWAYGIHLIGRSLLRLDYIKAKKHWNDFNKSV